VEFGYVAPDLPPPGMAGGGRGSRASATTKFEWLDEAEVQREPEIMERLSRLRMIEEDRDSLIEQVMRLKKQLELTRVDRKRADEDTSSAQARMEAMDREEGDRSRSDRETLTHLNSRVEQLSSQLDEAKKNMSSHSPQVIASLKQRTQQAEHELARLSVEQREAEQGLVKQIALSLKVTPNLKAPHTSNFKHRL